MSTKLTEKYVKFKSKLLGFYYRHFYKKIFDNLKKEKIKAYSQHKESSVWIITSVLEPVSRPLSYSSSRSYFSTQERLQQTRMSIISIQKVDPSGKILLVDGSKKNFSEKFLDMNIEFKHVSEVKFRRFVQSPFKGLGEAFLILSCRDELKGYDIVNKLSGRYCLTGYNPRQIPKIGYSSNKAITIHYALNSILFSAWLGFLSENLEKLTHGISIEDLLTEFADQNELGRVDDLGVEGRNGITGGYAKF